MLSKDGLKTFRNGRQPQKGRPLVSIVTVVYNNHKTIGRTIESVLGQSYENIEYIIIDGGSNDGTQDVVRRFADGIEYFVSEPDNGIYDAMNKGISICNGDIVGIINSDDWYESDAVAVIVDEYRKNPNCVQYGLCRYFDSEGEIVVQTPLASRLDRQMIEHSTCFVPRRYYLEYGLFDTKYKIAADYDLMLRLQKKGVAFKLHYKLISNRTFGGACQSNQNISVREVAEIRYCHGVITRNQMIRLIKKHELKRPVSFLADLMKKVYFK